MKIYCSWKDLSIGLNIGDWYFTFYGDFKVWGLKYHTNSPCCKWWVLLGPFEINRLWNDDDTDYPEGDIA